MLQMNWWPSWHGGMYKYTRFIFTVLFFLLCIYAADIVAVIGRYIFLFETITKTKFEIPATKVMVELAYLEGVFLLCCNNF